MNDASATPAATKAEKNVETVKMQDGRAVDFAGKRQMLKDANAGDNYAEVRFDFRNGETRTVRVEASNPLFTRYAAHGIAQKIGDEAAGEKDVDDAVLSIDDLIARLAKNEWTTKKEGGGMGGTSVLLRALVEATGKTTEQIKAFLANKSQAEKIALRNSKKYKPIVDRIEAEKASKAAKIDTSAMEAELENA